MTAFRTRRRWMTGICSIAGLALVTAIAPRGALAASQDPAIVGLAFDAATNALFEATSMSLRSSVDGGRTLQSVAVPQVSDRVRIAAVAHPASLSGTLYVAGPGLGVLRSIDGGRTWEARNSGLPGRGVVALTAHARQPHTVYAYLAGKGIYRSEDDGMRWRLMDAGPRGGITQFTHSDMPGSMQTGWLFAATSKGIGRSMDCFCGWRDAGGVTSSITAVAYDPGEPSRVYAATDDALLVSEDGGEHWSKRSVPTVITALLARPRVLYAGTRDGRVLRSSDRGLTWGRDNG